LHWPSSLEARLTIASANYEVTLPRLQVACGMANANAERLFRLQFCDAIRPDATILMHVLVRSARRAVIGNNTNT
jgi:hypothetical protein